MIRRESANPNRFRPKSSQLSAATAILFPGSCCLPAVAAPALIYEIVWFSVIATGDRLLGRIAGIASGCLHGDCVWARRSAVVVSRRHHPMRVYALLELGVAAFGIIALFGVPLIARFTSRAQAKQVWWD